MFTLSLWDIVCRLVRELLFLFFFLAYNHNKRNQKEALKNGEIHLRSSSACKDKRTFFSSQNVTNRNYEIAQKKTTLKYKNLIWERSVVGFWWGFFSSLWRTQSTETSPHILLTLHRVRKRHHRRVVGSDLDRCVTERARPSISAVCAARQRRTTRLDVGGCTGAILEEESKSAFRTKTPRRGYRLWPWRHPSSCLRVPILIQPWGHMPLWCNDSGDTGVGCIDVIKVPSVLDSPSGDDAPPALSINVRWSFRVVVSFVTAAGSITWILNSHKTNLFAKWGSRIQSGMQLTLDLHHSKLCIKLLNPRTSSFFGCSSFEFCTWRRLEQPPKCF